MSLFPNCPINPRELQPPLRTEKFEALYQLVRIGTICQDLSILLIYYIDTVDASVLVHLAQQFDMLGYKGWFFADTEERQRELIKDSIRLHRIAATCPVLVDRISYLDLQEFTISENPCLLYDGTWRYNGEFYYSGNRNDNFMLEGIYDLNESDRNNVRNVIFAWQRIASNLFEPFLPLIYDGTWTYNGDEIYDGISGNEITDYTPYRACETGSCFVPLPPQPPFKGGQCVGIEYEVDFTFKNDLGQDILLTVVAIYGPLLEMRWSITPAIPPAGEINVQVDGFTQGGLPVTRQQTVVRTPVTDYNQTPIIDVRRVDGFPDDCGDPPIPEV